MQPGPGGKRKDRPELFFPRGFTPPSDGLESRPCPMHPLGIGVWDASRLIDPRNPPTSPGGWVHPLMDGHPHRCSTDFEQTLLGGQRKLPGAHAHVPLAEPLAEPLAAGAKPLAHTEQLERFWPPANNSDVARKGHAVHAAAPAAAKEPLKTAGCWVSMSPQVPLGTRPFLVRPVSLESGRDGGEVRVMTHTRA